MSASLVLIDFSATLLDYKRPWRSFERNPRYVQRLVSEETTIKLDFGTEGGLFQSRLGIPTVVCGPGSMAQGHKPDEFIERSELTRCDLFLDRLIDSISL